MPTLAGPQEVQRRNKRVAERVTFANQTVAITRRATVRRVKSHSMLQGPLLPLKVGYHGFVVDNTGDGFPVLCDRLYSLDWLLDNPDHICDCGRLGQRAEEVRKWDVGLS